MKEALCIIIFFLVAISLNAQSTVFRRDSFVDYGGDIAYKVEVVSLEVVKDTALINARRLEIYAKLTGLCLNWNTWMTLKVNGRRLTWAVSRLCRVRQTVKHLLKSPLHPKSSLQTAIPNPQNQKSNERKMLFRI